MFRFIRPVILILKKNLLILVLKRNISKKKRGLIKTIGKHYEANSNKL